MDDLISRRALIEEANKLENEHTRDVVKGLATMLPSVQRGRDFGGCVVCAFYDREEWEMPCAKCCHASRDYWRYKE